MKILCCTAILIAMASPVLAGQYDQTLIEYCEKAATKPALKLPEAEAAAKYCDGVAPAETVSTLNARANTLRDAEAARQAAASTPPPPAPLQTQRPTAPRPDAAASCRTIVASAQNEMEKEKKIGAVSGYVNMSRMHQLGRVIVECQEIIKNAKTAPLRAPATSSAPNPISQRVPVPN